MECKHCTHEPCDLCAEENAEHDREMAIQARIDAAVAAERERCAKMVENQNTYGDRLDGWLELLADKIRA